LIHPLQSGINAAFHGISFGAHTFTRASIFSARAASLILRQTDIAGKVSVSTGRNQSPGYRGGRNRGSSRDLLVLKRAAMMQSRCKRTPLIAKLDYIGGLGFEASVSCIVNAASFLNRTP
jgi:hypothetical protein